MPEISRFFGIVVTMHYDDHVPPHFHARYGSHKSTIAIHPLRVLAGELPPRALGFVMEWAALHQEELAADWALACRHRPLRRIPPLQ